MDLEEITDFLQVQKMARERGYRYFKLRNGDAYALYDVETDEKISGKKLIPAKEALELMSRRVRHFELHGDNDSDNV
jgi:hypothetical protein